MNIENTLAKALGLEVWEFRLMLIMEQLQRVIDRDEDRAGQAEDVPVDEKHIPRATKAVKPSNKSDAYWLAEQKKAADNLGQFIADELLQKNYQVLRIAADGWNNLSSGKPFKNKSGKPSNRICVYHEWVNLVMRGNLEPSTEEMRVRLAGRQPPVKMGKERLSKLIQELGMEGLFRDGRLAKNRGKEGRKFTAPWEFPISR